MYSQPVVFGNIFEMRTHNLLLWMGEFGAIPMPQTMFVRDFSSNKLVTSRNVLSFKTKIIINMWARLERGAQTLLDVYLTIFVTKIIDRPTYYICTF